MSASVLVVDDEPAFRVLCEEALSAEGFDVRVAGNLARARAEVEGFSPDIVILDRRLPDGDGIEFLRSLRAEGASAPLVVVVTAYGDVENAVEALRAGAWDYLAKPVQLTDLVVKLRKVLEARGLKDRLQLARTGGSRPPLVDPRSPAMREVVERLRSVAVSPMTPVFLHGPSGVGKQYAAELLHQFTYGETDRDAPFVELNCAALPEDLVESELFGHERGAFTDAKGMRRGLVEMATGGTLFLDEISEMPLRSQAKLLKFIDSMRFRRLGGQRELSVQLRVVAATNRDLREAVRTGQFREDLFHRLTVFSVSIPPLAQRKEDVPALAEAFLKFFSARVKKRAVSFTPDALKALQAYEFPGNVRELRNLVERAVILARGEAIHAQDIMLSNTPAEAPGAPGFFHVELDGSGAPPSLDDVEKRYVVQVLRHLGGQRLLAAKALGISYPTFLKHLRDAGHDEK